MYRTPPGPTTLAISCGSVTIVVTPRGTTAAANCGGVQRLLSTWTWASIRPGATNAPCRSIKLWPTSDGPTAAILSPQIATSAG